MTMFLFKLICIVLTPKKSRLLHGENESNPRKFDDLENKIIILGGDFNLFLDSVPKSEGGSLVLKKIVSKLVFTGNIFMNLIYAKFVRLWKIINKEFLKKNNFIYFSLCNYQMSIFSCTANFN